MKPPLSHPSQERTLLPAKISASSSISFAFRRMMSRGRGSASRAAAVALALVYLLAQAEYARAATYTVGGSGGWTFNMVNWPRGKSFRAGDTLIFKYDRTNHNVVALDKASYDSCRTPRTAKVYTSGNDQIKLAKGPNFFICNFPGHCESAMKIAVNAA